MREKLLLVLMLWVFILSGCSKDEVSEFKKGTVTETTYESEWLNLSFELPENYVMYVEDEMTDVMQTGSDIVSEHLDVDLDDVTVYHEMMASDITNGSNIAIIVEQLPNKLVTKNMIIDNMIKQLKEINPSAIITEDDKKETVAGTEYSKFEIVINESDSEYKQTYLLSKKGDKIVSIILTCFPGSDYDYKYMLNSFSSYNANKEASTEEFTEHKVDELEQSDVLDETSSTLEQNSEFEKGLLSETTYESKWLNLKFELPENYIMLSEEELMSFVEPQEKNISEQLDVNIDDYSVYYEMMAINLTTNTNLMLTVEELQYENLTPEQYLQVSVDQLLQTNSLITVDESISTEVIGGSDYLKLEVQGSQDNVSYNQTYLANKIGNKMVLIVITIPETDTVDAYNTIISSISSIN